MKIYLIGMPGSGKSTIGKILAEKINYEFIDLDAQIEKESLFFIDELIENYGIEKFRQIESETIKKINGNNLVIACGGGIVENLKNKQFMDGKIIFLDVEIEILKTRLKNDYQRPLLKEYTLEEIHQKRFLFYQHFADINISNNTEIENTISNIIMQVEEL